MPATVVATSRSRRPFLVSRRVTAMLRAEGACRQPQAGTAVDVQDGMRGSGQSRASAGLRRSFPYRLRGLVIDRANQVWCADMTYIPIGRGFLYFVAVMDWASRAVLAWRLSNTMDVSFCVSAPEEALARLGPPEIFNTDQATGSPAAPSPNGHTGGSRYSRLDGCRGRCFKLRRGV